MGRKVLEFPEKTGYVFEFLNQPALTFNNVYHVTKTHYSNALVSKASRVVDLKEGTFIKDAVKDLRVHEFISSLRSYSPFTTECLDRLGLSSLVTSRIRDVFFDMDGTLFDYDTQILNIGGRPLSELTKEEKYKVSSTHGFFSTMPIYEGVDELFEIIKKAGVNVHILSAVGEREPSRITKEKTQALHDKLSHWKLKSVIFVNRSVDKAFYAKDSRLLIDDRERAFSPFKYAGGHIIEHVNVKTTRDILLQLW